MNIIKRESPAPCRTKHPERAPDGAQVRPDGKQAPVRTTHFAPRKAPRLEGVRYTALADGSACSGATTPNNSHEQLPALWRIGSCATPPRIDKPRNARLRALPSPPRTTLDRELKREAALAIVSQGGHGKRARGTGAGRTLTPLEPGGAQLSAIPRLHGHRYPPPRRT